MSDTQPPLTGGTVPADPAADAGADTGAPPSAAGAPAAAPSASGPMPRNPDLPPRAAAVLGYAGTVPFVAMAFVIFFLYPRPEAQAVLAAQIGYGAVILSFLGGIRWALAMLFPEDAQLGRRLAAAAAPALIGWGALFMPPAWGLVTLIAAFWAQAASDLRATRARQAPRWFGGYRVRLTILVVLALLLTLFGMAVRA